jgi:hypothetical protein
LLIPWAIRRTYRCCISACTPLVGVRLLSPITTSEQSRCCNAHWNPLHAERRLKMSEVGADGLDVGGQDDVVLVGDGLRV